MTKITIVVDGAMGPLTPWAPVQCTACTYDFYDTDYNVFILLIINTYTIYNK